MILQDNLPEDLRLPRPLPGIAPLDPHDWLVVDEAFAAQIAERDRLLATRRGDVLAVTPQGKAAAREVLEAVLGALGPAYARQGNEVTRPDGVRVPLLWDDPLLSAGRLVQEDLCLMQERDGVHVLVAAVLCFPASWSLDQKIGKPLLAIHAPVAEYDGDLAQRVQRLFHGIKVGRPLWRSNRLRYSAPDLFAPRREGDPHPLAGADAGFIRAERQCLLRLPRTGAVVFSIHTWMVRDAPDSVVRDAPDSAVRDAPDVKPLES